MASSFSKLADDVPKANNDANGTESEAESLLGQKRGRDLDEQMKQRDEIRRLMRKENERNRRREAAGKNKTKSERDADRDISEKIALG
jgi:hypothetical protein